jgi:hypothetical protein
MASQNGVPDSKPESESCTPGNEERDPYFPYSEEKTLQHVSQRRHRTVNTEMA